MNSTHDQRGSPVFATTRWSVVDLLKAGDTPAAAAAMESLCRTYWPPVYGFIRRAGRSPEDAADLTQSFFERVLEKGWFEDAEQSRGRFRSFLLAALKHFLANEYHKAKTQRRGGGHEFVALDAGEMESHAQIAAAGELPPDQAFEHRWAVALLDQVMDDLAADFRARGDARLFEGLKPCLAADRDRLGYAELGKGLGLNEGAVKVAVHRLRKRYRELLRQRVAQTVSGGDEVEAELRHLLRVLAGS